MEELVVELSSAILGAELGLLHLQNWLFQLPTPVHFTGVRSFPY